MNINPADYSSYSALASATLAFSKKAKQVLSQALYENLVISDVAARKDMQRTIKLAADPPFDEAITELIGRMPITAEQFARIEKKYKRFVFGTKSLMGLQDSIQYVILERAKDLIREALAGGVTYADFKKQMKVAAPFVPDYRLELIFQQNVMTAYASGAWQQQFEQLDEDIELVYKTAGDERVREEHVALDGFVALKSDPIWETIYPPNGFNCRCGVRMALAADRKNAVREVDPSGIDPEFRSWPGDGFTLALPTSSELEDVSEWLEGL